MFGLMFRGLTNKQKGEIGSSAMPHKVNPFDFENAEKLWDSQYYLRAPCS